MKSILIFTNLLTLCILVFIVLTGHKSEDTFSENPQQGYEVCHNCTSKGFYSLRKSFFDSCVSRYNYNHGRKIDNVISGIHDDKKMKDARTAWFPLDSIMKFVCLTRKYADELNVDEHRLGIRFYYAVYPKKMENKRKSSPLLIKNKDTNICGDKDYKSRHTLFMVPTYRDTLCDHVDVDLRWSAIQKGKPKQNVAFRSNTSVTRTLYSLREMSGSSDAFVYDGAAVESGQSQNQGQLCPPTCPTTVASTLNQILGARETSEVRY
jgi:hypothetical protein